MVFPGKTRVLLRPELFHDGDGFIGDGAPFGIGTAHRLRLRRNRADAHSQHHPAATQHVQGGGGFGEPDRIVIRQHEHRGAQAHALGAGGHVAEEGQGLVIGPVPDAAEHVAGIEDVVVDPHRGKPQRLGPAGELDKGLYILDAPVVEQRDADLHGIMLLARDKGSEPPYGLLPSLLIVIITPSTAALGMKPRPAAEQQSVSPTRLGYAGVSCFCNLNATE